MIKTTPIQITPQEEEEPTSYRIYVTVKTGCTAPHLAYHIGRQSEDDPTHYDQPSRMQTGGAYSLFFATLEDAIGRFVAQIEHEVIPAEESLSYEIGRPPWQYGLGERIRILESLETEGYPIIGQDQQAYLLERIQKYSTRMEEPK